MKLEFIWGNVCFNILIGIQYERPKLKGQMSTLTFGTYLGYCLIRLNISSENND